MSKENIDKSKAPWKFTLATSIIIAFIGIIPGTIAIILNNSSKQLEQDNHSRTKSEIEDEIEKYFKCERTYSEKKAKEIPTTLVEFEGEWYPFIFWESKYFEKSGYTPQKRCNIATRRLKELKADGNLEYINLGEVKNENVFCGVKEQDNNCNKQNLFITLQRNENAEEIYKEILNIRAYPESRSMTRGGKLYDMKMLYQSIKNGNIKPHKKTW